MYYLDFSPYASYTSSKSSPLEEFNNVTININNIVNTNQTILSNSSLSNPYHVPDIISHVINLANHYNHSNNPTHTILEISKVLNVRLECLINVSSNGSFKILNYCELPNNISFTIHNFIGGGGQSFVYNVTIIDNKSINQDYILQIDHPYREQCLEYQQQHTLLIQLDPYSNSSLNIPFVYPNMPVYYDELSKHCLMFSKQIPNTITFTQLFIVGATDSKKYLSAIIESKGNIIQFIVDCYNDIMAIYYRMFDKLNTFHNDRHPSNILIDKTTFTCYLIDFGSLFYKENMLNRRRPKIHSKGIGSPFYCHPMSCSPLVKQYLFKPLSRRIFKEQLAKGKDAADVLYRLGMYAVDYETAAYMFHAFVKLYYLQIAKKHQDTLYKMNKFVLNIQHKGFRRVRNKAWCYRYELYCKFVRNMNYSVIASASYGLQQNLLNIMNIFENDARFMHNTKC